MRYYSILFMISVIWCHLESGIFAQSLEIAQENDAIDGKGIWRDWRDERISVKIPKECAIAVENHGKENSHDSLEWTYYMISKDRRRILLSFKVSTPPDSGKLMLREPLEKQEVNEDGNHLILQKFEDAIVFSVANETVSAIGLVELDDKQRTKQLISVLKSVRPCKK